MVLISELYLALFLSGFSSSDICITGRVVNVTSAKGRICLPSNAVYGAAKYAVEAFSDCLRLEMKKFGVQVVIVEPGDYGGTTGMLSKKTVSTYQVVHVKGLYRLLYSIAPQTLSLSPHYVYKTSV